MRTFRWSIFALLLSLLGGPHSVFAYSVNGGRIVDAQGQAVQLRGVNWFGFETTDHVVHGLWYCNWKSMIDQMRDLGINAVRLPVCPGTLRGSTPSTINYGLNPDLAGRDSLGVLDAVVQYLDAQGFYVLLDHHRPDCQSVSELWYTAKYSEQQWIADLTFLAQRYGARPHVIGVDLKNEPHRAATWGTGNPATDWNKAAERAAAAVAGVAPHWLIFVEGIQEILVLGQQSSVLGRKISNPCLARRCLSPPTVWCCPRTPTAPMCSGSPTSMTRPSPTIWRQSGIATSGSSSVPAMP